MGMLMAGPFLTGWSATMADFKARCEQATDDADHRAVLVAADSLLRMAQAAGNSYYEAYGHYYQGVSNVLLGRAQQGLQQLRRAEQLAQTQHNDTLIVFIYNAYGIYEANKSNYAVARSYFYKSLTRALEQNDRLRQAKLELNLAEVAFLLKDTSGLAYARSAYEWAEANGNDEVMLVGAYQCANLSYLQRKPEEALRYLAKVKKLAEQGHYKEWSSIHKLYADVYLMMGRYAQAEEELEAALANRDNAAGTPGSSADFTLLSTLQPVGPTGPAGVPGPTEAGKDGQQLEKKGEKWEPWCAFGAEYPVQYTNCVQGPMAPDKHGFFGQVILGETVRRLVSRVYDPLQLRLPSAGPQPGAGGMEKPLY